MAALGEPPLELREGEEEEEGEARRRRLPIRAQLEEGGTRQRDGARQQSGGRAKEPPAQGEGQETRCRGEEHAGPLEPRCDSAPSHAKKGASRSGCSSPCISGTVPNGVSEAHVQGRGV